MPMVDYIITLNSHILMVIWYVSKQIGEWCGVWAFSG